MLTSLKPTACSHLANSCMQCEHLPCQRADFGKRANYSVKYCNQQWHKCWKCRNNHSWTLTILGMRKRSWLRHYARSRKVVGLIPNVVIGFFNWPNPSSCTLALESTQPLTEMSTRNLPGGKGLLERKADNLADCLENVAASTSHNPMGLHSLLQAWLLKKVCAQWIPKTLTSDQKVRHVCCLPNICASLNWRETHS
jgi:hypothetical protein